MDGAAAISKDALCHLIVLFKLLAMSTMTQNWIRAPTQITVYPDDKRTEEQELQNNRMYMEQD